MKFRKNTTTKPEAISPPGESAAIASSWQTLFGFFREDPRTYTVEIALSVIIGALEFLGVSSMVPVLGVLLGNEATALPSFLRPYIGSFSPWLIGGVFVILIVAQTVISFLREEYFLHKMAHWRTTLSLEYIRNIAFSDWRGLGKLQPGEVEVMLTRNIALSVKLRHMTANFIADGILSIMYIGIVIWLSGYTIILFVVLGVIFGLINRATTASRKRFAVLARDRYILIARKVIEYFSDGRALAISNKDSLLGVLRRYLEDAAHAQERNDRYNVLFKHLQQPILLCFFIISAAIFFSIGFPLATLAGIFYIFYRAAPRLISVAGGYGTIVGESSIDVAPEIRKWGLLKTDFAGAKQAKDTGVDLRDVALSYKPGETVVEAVTLRIEPGEFVCIVGKSGTGKSTILDLLCGFQEPIKGTALFGGVLYEELDWGAWRNRLAIVRTEGVIVSGTWVDNVAFLDDHPDLVRIESLLEQVGLRELFESDPLGVHAPLFARGSNLSAGQRQRLLVARALYRDPQLLILDEPTSNLDVNTEQFINELLFSLKGKKTIVVVSHREAVQAHADRVYEVTDTGLIIVVPQVSHIV